MKQGNFELPKEFAFLTVRKEALLLELQAIEALEQTVIKSRELVERLDTCQGMLTREEWAASQTHDYVKYFLTNDLEFRPDHPSLTQPTDPGNP